MYALLLSLSVALAGEPCAPQGDPALPIPLDSTFTPVEFGPLGSELIETGFTFRFYGRDYNSAWVNANGTISFCQPVLPDIGTGIPSLGRPLIAPRSPDAADLLRHQENAWLVESDQLSELVEQVQYLCDHTEVCAQLTQGALTSARALTWDARGEKISHQIKRWRQR